MRSEQAVIKLLIDNNQLLSSMLSMLLAGSSADNVLKKVAADIIDQAGETIIEVREAG